MPRSQNMVYASTLSLTVNETSHPLMTQVMGTLTVFGAEKVVFQREYGSRMYGLFAYFWSRWLVDLPSHIILPIISCCIMNW